MRTMSRQQIKKPEYKIHEEIRKSYKELLEGNGKLIVKISEDIGSQTTEIKNEKGKVIKKGVSASQIRKIYGDLKRRQYQKFDINKIQLIRPKLAYTFSRHNDLRGMDLLLGSIDFLIDKIEFSEHYENLVNLFEAILAYHKKYGGK